MYFLVSFNTSISLTSEETKMMYYDAFCLKKISLSQLLFTGRITSRL